VRGRETTHVAVQLPTLPQYHEQMIIDALTRKLSPSMAARRPEAEARADAGRRRGGPTAASSLSPDHRRDVAGDHRGDVEPA
jgi:hypothetical protein